jgi:hypothetical protein
MEKKMIMVKSASNSTLVVFIPELNLNKAWTKKGMRLPIDRDVLMQACYNDGVINLVSSGRLIIEDKEFLIEAGFMSAEQIEDLVELTDAYMQRLIKNMPLSEVKKEVVKLSQAQIEEVVNYAIMHYTDLAMDRVDLFSKISGKDMMQAIANYKAAQED